MVHSLIAADFTSMQWLPGYEAWDHAMAHHFGNGVLTGEPVHSVTHLVYVGIACLVVLLLALLTRSSWGRDADPVVPAGGFGPRNLAEGIMDVCLNFGEMVMGNREHAKRFLPLIGALAFYIFFNNILGLVPYFGGTTSNLNVTVGPAVVVFLVTHYVGFKENGLHYLDHFLGPRIGGLPLLAPLFVPLEIISHLARVLSLSLRLMANMMADHIVLGIFSTLLAFSLLIPLPIYALGTIVCIIQTVVFCLLSLVYISLSLEHSEEGH